MKAIIWHNPRCSKSRAALALLESAPGVEVEEYRYLDDPPSRERLAGVLMRAGLAPRDVLRGGEAEADGLGDAGDAALLDAMAAHPILIERPLVETERGVVLGRPPERVLELVTP